MSTMFLFEVCVDNIESVRNAFAGGADRLELCSALSEGGLTPSLGFLKSARNATAPDFPIFAMIRPRGGNFIYDEAEVAIMEEDIKNLKEGGANGFVFGLLTSINSVDTVNCQRLLEVCKPLPVTFHRAFDEIKSMKEQLEAVETISALGFSRLLTSGGAATAEKGLAVISRLNEHCDGQLIIMPGAGVNPTNIRLILEGTRAREFHGSAKGSSEDSRTITDKAIVRKMREIHSHLEVAPF